MNLKTILSALVVSSMLFSSVICNAAEENKVVDNFESYTEFANEGPWTNKNPIVADSGGNKAAVFGAGTGLATLDMQIPGFSPDVTGLIANFSIKFTGDVKQHVIFGAASSNAPTNGSDRVLQFYGGGSKLQICAAAKYDMYYFYTTDKWYDVSIRLNYNTGYYELSINDGTTTQNWVQTSTILARPTSDNKAAIKYFSFWIHNRNANQAVFIDNVNIYGVTGDRIYPSFNETNSFASFTAAGVGAVPNGYTTESTLEEGNGFGASNGSLNFASESGKSLSLTKSFSDAITPPTVKLSLKEAANINLGLKLADENGNTEEISISSDAITFGDTVISYPLVGDENICVTAKDGKLRVIVSGEEEFAAGEKGTSLSSLKTFSLLSGDDIDTDITINAIDYATSTYFEKVSSTVEDGSVLPNTNTITLNFSNNLAVGSNGTFAIDGDASVEDVIYGAKSVSIKLSDNLSASTVYTLNFDNVYDIEGCAISGEIVFETDVAVAADSFEIADEGENFTITTNLKSNTGKTVDGVLLLTVYDNSTGKIVSMDFKNVTLIASPQPFSVSVAEPDCASYSVEAYLWSSFENMSSLGFTAIEEVNNDA